MIVACNKYTKTRMRLNSKTIEQSNNFMYIPWSNNTKRSTTPSARLSFGKKR